MGNEYFERVAEDRLLGGTTARAEDVEAAFNQVSTGFSKLPDPRTDGLVGFGVPVTIEPATELSHALTLAQADVAAEAYRLTDPPSNGSAYARKGAAWVNPEGEFAVIPEAPVDGAAYLRSGGAWLDAQAYVAALPVTVTLTIDDDLGV